MGRDSAHISNVVDFDAQQRKLRAIGGVRLKWDPRQAQEARRIARCNESFDERCHDEIEIALNVRSAVHLLVGLLTREQLPLGRPIRRADVIMTGARHHRRAAVVLDVIAVLSSMHVIASISDRLVDQRLVGTKLAVCD
jgi:hypothetical protein